MEHFSLLLQVFAFMIMTSFEIVTRVVDEVVFTFEDNEVYGKIFRIFSFCVGNFYFWQALATIGFYHSLRRVADNFPAHPTAAVSPSPVHVGPSMEQLLEENKPALNAAVSQNENFARENADLRAKVDLLQTEVEYITNDRYALVRENLVIQNKLGDFNSWPEFRIGYHQLTAEFVAMKSQRAKEHVLQERTRRIAKETKVELAAAKRAEAKIKIAHRKEFERLQLERDEAKEKYRTLLATTSAAATSNTATTTLAVTATAATNTIPIAKGNIPENFNLQEESSRLTFLLQSHSSLISSLSSDLDRLRSDLKARSNQSAFKLNMAALTITGLEREKAKAEERIAKLEKNVHEANAKAEEMEELYMLVAFGDGGESGSDESGGEGKDKEEDDGGKED